MLRQLRILSLIVLGLVSSPIITTPVQAASMSDYLENKVIDWLFRGQAYTPPTMYVALATTTGSDTACGTEVSGGNYARVSVGTPSLSIWAGTQSAASTTASTGTSGTTSNNAAINFATPSATWGTVSEFCMMDALSGGNMLWRVALTTPKTINANDTVSFPAAALTFQIDN